MPDIKDRLPVFFYLAEGQVLVGEGFSIEVSYLPFRSIIGPAGDLRLFETQDLFRLFIGMNNLPFFVLT